MLRGIHKASANWIGRAVMGVVLGLIAVSFGIWGIGDIFRGFAPTPSPRSAAPKSASTRSVSLSGPVAAARPATLAADPARSGTRARPRSAVAEPDDRRHRARRARPLASDSTSSRPRWARRITEAPDFKGINGQSSARRFDAYLRIVRLYRNAVHGGAAAHRVRQQLMGTISGDWWFRRRRSRRSISFKTKNAASTT